MDLSAVCRLHNTYQSASSEAEDVNIELILNQCTDRDATLVQLSTLRLIFERKSYSQLHRVIVDNPLLNNLLVAGLSSGDTLVCFCCCKVLVAMFMTSDVTCKQNFWIEFSLSHSVSEVSNHWQTSVYCLQCLAEVLKLLRRKKLHSEPNPGDLLCCSCMQYLHTWWPKIANCLLDSRTTILVKLTFLSIAVETFRHSVLVKSDLCEARQLCVCIFHELPRLVSSVKLWTPCALLVLYEVVTVLCKVLEDSTIMAEVYDTFTELLYCCIRTNQLVFESIALKDVVTRKLLLLLLKYTAVTLEEGIVDMRKLGQLGGFICELVKNSPDAQQIIFEHLREQDDSLVEGLAAACRIHWSLLNLPAEIRETSQAVDHLRVINVHAFMLQFFSSTSFDHSILLDFVMSGDSESKFETFLVKYLELGVADWHGLRAVCAQADADGTRERNFSSESTLDSFMGTLLKFKYRLLRLCSKGLFPHPVEDMLTALEKLEELYEHENM